ncbi:MAG: MgtC/SapB family protein [Opitutales bacterium]
MTLIEQLILLAHVTGAAGLGAVIGWERESAAKPAGLRTHMTVCGACCLFVILARAFVPFFITVAEIHEEPFAIDPIRTLQAIVIGVSFIGAGTILKAPQEDRVYFLTTAASVLVSAGVGMAVALRLYLAAMGIACLFFVIQHWLGSSKAPQ